jgi:hypothetical protein
MKQLNAKQRAAKRKQDEKGKKIYSLNMEIIKLENRVDDIYNGMSQGDPIALTAAISDIQDEIESLLV